MKSMEGRGAIDLNGWLSWIVVVAGLGHGVSDQCVLRGYDDLLRRGLGNIVTMPRCTASE